ncbi:hypothetical protein ETH_00004615 [Eimeria tenella]|uniref:Uncharacterized protein n=1 Tax=Eimeria tenella TaxID=5802 RepID=U6KFX4_EIMTE|nr:hypothetical protein ETH_00004615 [Eimeria tenella]CDJ36930.1 hypothetical protein ETH_00004615 [Eimeria tenella]|eukprot:XP_013227768.1 hypothetical protein ETH_00004615 [Eimeria tenella]
MHMKKQVEENLEMPLGGLGEMTVEELCLQNILMERLESPLHEPTQGLLDGSTANLQIHMKKRVEENLEISPGDLGEMTVEELSLQNILMERMESPLHEPTQGLLDGSTANLQIHMKKRVEENLEISPGDLGEMTVEEQSLQVILNERMESPLHEPTQGLLDGSTANLQIHMKKRVEENLEMPSGGLGEMTVEELSLQNILMERPESPLQELTQGL